MGQDNPGSHGTHQVQQASMPKPHGPVYGARPVSPLHLPARAAAAAAMAAGFGLAAAAAAARFPAALLWASGAAVLPCVWLAQGGARLRRDAWGALGLTALVAAVLPSLALLLDPDGAVSHTQVFGLAATAESCAVFGALGFLAAARLWPPQLVTAQPSIAPPRWLRSALLFALAATAVALPLSIAATQLALAACGLLLLVALALGARPRLRSAIDAPVLALLAVAVGSSLFSARPALLETPALRALIAFFVLSRALRLVALGDPHGDARGVEILWLKLGGLWALSASGDALLAFAQHWSGFDLTHALGFRPELQVPAPGAPGRFAGMGTLSSRLSFAHVTLLPAALLAGLLAAGALPRRAAWLSRVAIFCMCLGLWSSFARGAWLAFGAILLLLGLLAGTAATLRRGLPAAVALSLLGGALLWSSPAARARAVSGLSLRDNRDRLFLWARGVEIAADHPVVGVGFGSYPWALGPYYDRREPSFPMRTQAHDMFLSIWAETGPLGLFAFLWLLCAAVGLAVASRRASSPVRRGLLAGAGLAAGAFSVLCLMHDPLYEREVAYNLFFVLALAAVTRAGNTGPARLSTPTPVASAEATASHSASQPTRHEPGGGRASIALFVNLRELWQYRALIGALTTRELKARYRGSMLGFLWTFVNPLLLMSVYLLVFGVFLKQQMPHYTFFMFVGLLPWMWFASALGGGTASLASKRDLLTRVRFPPQVLPAVVVISELTNYLLATPLMVALGLATGVTFHWTALLFPLVIAIQVLFTLGLVYITSALNVFFRDLQHVVNNFITLWFFLVPVLYSRTLVPASVRPAVIAFDPMAVFITSYQDIWFEGVLPNFAYLGFALLCSLLLLSVAARIFESRRDEFAEIV